jgi:hypothetical protein
MAFFDSDVVESPSDIHLCEVPGILEVVDDILDEWGHASVLLCVLLKLLVVHNWSELAFFMFEEKEACVGRLAWADPSGLQVFIQELVQFCLFFLCQ